MMVFPAHRDILSMVNVKYIKKVLVVVVVVVIVVGQTVGSKLFLKEFTVVLVTTSFGRTYQIVVILFG